MSSSAWHWQKVLFVPLVAACGLQILGWITANERLQQRQIYEARLVNGMLGRDLSEAPNWERLSALAAYPKVRRIRVSASDGGSVEVWLGWRAQGGYAGPVDLAIAFDGHARVHQVRLLKHSETPGLGDRVEFRNSDWLLQFLGIGFFEDARLRARQGQIDAISGATITSAAVARGVAGALAAFVQSKGQDR